MIYPKNNKLIFWFFKRYVQWRVGRQFHEILFNEIDVDKNKSILLIANHYSFWDSLVIFMINERLLKKKPHVMVLEETMKKERFLKYAGAFSVKKNSRSILETINYAATLLDDPGNLVVIFPQGKLFSNFVEHIHFEPGVARIIEKTKGNFQLIFIAAFIQYFKQPKPTVTVYLKTEIINHAGHSPDGLQNAYQQHYDASKLLQTEIDTNQ
jgi:1-acyl-sn-glycerol-3-phosphate acyltransferase